MPLECRTVHSYVDNHVCVYVYVFSSVVAGDGKMRYERDFLMQFKNLDVCKEIPAGLKSSQLLMMDGMGSGNLMLPSHHSRSNDRKGVGATVSGCGLCCVCVCV